MCGKLGVSCGHVRKMVVWGEHGGSELMRVDSQHAEVQQLGQWSPLPVAVHDDHWLRHHLVKVPHLTSSPSTVLFTTSPKAVTRQVFWVFEHPLTRNFKGKFEKPKQSYISYTTFAKLTTGLDTGYQFWPGLHPGPHWGLTALPHTPIWLGGGSPPSHQEPHTASARWVSSFGSLGLAVSSHSPPQSKF